MRNYFDEPVASTYDEDASEMFDDAVLGPPVSFLAALADGGRALELGIGTGRVALALHDRGVAVSGIDLSPDMVARLRAKPGADDVEVVIGDFATAKVAGQFRLAYLVFNTIGNLTDQGSQVACFRNAAAHLEDGGKFVIEVGMPELRKLPPGESFVVFDHADAHVGIDEYDVSQQRLVSHHYRNVSGRFQRVSVPFRYVWPAELDLMAELAGMALVERWGDWDRSPFTHESTKHISVWAKHG